MPAKHAEAESAGQPFDGSRLVAIYKKVRPVLAQVAVFSPQAAAFLAFCDTIFASPEALEAAHHVARGA